MAAGIVGKNFIPFLSPAASETAVCSLLLSQGKSSHDRLTFLLGLCSCFFKNPIRFQVLLATEENLACQVALLNIVGLSLECMGPRPMGRTWKGVPMVLRRIYCVLQRTVSSSIRSSSLNVRVLISAKRKDSIYLQVWLPQPSSKPPDLIVHLETRLHYNLGYR